MRLDLLERDLSGALELVEDVSKVAWHEAEQYGAEAAALVDGLSDLDLALRLDAAVHLAGAAL